jgi:hypothetical protein
MSSIDPQQANIPMPVQQLNYASGIMTPEWRTMLRILAGVGCAVGAGRIVAGCSPLALLLPGIPSSWAGSWVAIGMSLPALVVGILLLVGSITELRGRQSGLGLMVISAWISAIAGVLSLVMVLVQAAVGMPKSLGIGYGVYAVVAGIGRILNDLSFPLITMLMVRAYRRASTMLN